MKTELLKYILRDVLVKSSKFLKPVITCTVVGAIVGWTVYFYADSQNLDALSNAATHLDDCYSEVRCTYNRLVWYESRLASFAKTRYADMSNANFIADYFNTKSSRDSIVNSIDGLEKKVEQAQTIKNECEKQVKTTRSQVSSYWKLGALAGVALGTIAYLATTAVKVGSKVLA